MVYYESINDPSYYSLRLELVPLRGPDLHPGLAPHLRRYEPVQVLGVDHERPHGPRRLRTRLE